MGKPAGFTKPAGLSRQTASNAVDEEEEEVGLQPVHIGLSAVALLIALLFCWQTYSADQTPNRTSDYFFGTPSVSDSSGSSDSSASSEDSEASDEGDSSEDSEDDSDEEE